MPQEDKKQARAPQVRRAVTIPGTTAPQPGSDSLRPRSAGDEAARRAEEPDSSAHGGARADEPPAVVATSSRPVSSASSSEDASDMSDPDDASRTGASAPGASRTGTSATDTSQTGTTRTDTSQTGTSATGTSATGSPAAGTSSADSEADDASSRASVPGAKKADENGGAAVGSLTAAVGGSPPGATRGDTGADGNEPPSGRPTKALLAAAGLGGALLIAVPFLVMGAQKHDKTEPAAASKGSSGRTLQLDEEKVRPGAYAPKSPEAGDGKKDGKQKDKKQQQKKKKKKRQKEDGGGEEKAPAKSVSVEQGHKKQKGEKKHPKRKKRVMLRAAAAHNYANQKHVLLRNVASNLCADIPNYGKGRPDGPVNQFHCADTSRDNQIWDFEVSYKNKGPRSTDLFQIRNRKDRLCMDLPNFRGQPRGTRVSEYPCDGTTADNQLWWLERRGKKTFRIHNYASNNQCLAVVRRNKPVDARLNIQPCGKGDGFAWKLS